MPPTDASTDAGTAPFTTIGSDTGPGADTEDTLDLRLPDELLALFAGKTESEKTEALGGAAERGERSGGEGDTTYGSTQAAARGTMTPVPVAPARDDLLDRVGDWGPTATAAGVFHLVPVALDRDLPLISRWMNDPAVAAFWELSGPETETEDHLRAQLGGDGRSVPCLGVLDGTPMSYWEIYRADLDPLARHYPARLHDTGTPPPHRRCRQSRARTRHDSAQSRLRSRPRPATLMRTRHR